MTFRQSVPTLVTMVTLACGLAAFETTRVGLWEWSLRLILLAAVADGVDGMLARRLRAASATGEQLDSLADIVAFGVAPAFLFSTAYAASGPIRFGVALVFVLAAAYRLARFHAQPATGVFCGLPTTTAGPLLALAVVGPFGLGPREAGVVGIVLAVLMVSHRPFLAFSRPRRWVLPVIAAGALPIALWPRVETLAVLATLAFGSYAVSGLVGPLLIDDGIRRRRVEEVAEVDRPRS